jgi:hypothetical protein
MRHELTDYGWAAIKPFLPNKPRGAACEYADQDRPIGIGRERASPASMPLQVSVPP